MNAHRITVDWTDGRASCACGWSSGIYERMSELREAVMYHLRGPAAR